MKLAKLVLADQITILNEPKRKRRCEINCNQHKFSLSNLTNQDNSLDTQLDFCPKYHRGNVPPQTTYPSYNNDKLYYTSAFILGVDRKLNEKIQQQEYLQHARIVRVTYQKNCKVMFPKPNQKHTLCSVCKIGYFNYYVHILSEQHKEMVGKGEYNSHIEKLAGKFRQLHPKDRVEISSPFLIPEGFMSNNKKIRNDRRYIEDDQTIQVVKKDKRYSDYRNTNKINGNIIGKKQIQDKRKKFRRKYGKNKKICIQVQDLFSFQEQYNGRQIKNTNPNQKSNERANGLDNKKNVNQKNQPNFNVKQFDDSDCLSQEGQSVLSSSSTELDNNSDRTLFVRTTNVSIQTDANVGHEYTINIQNKFDRCGYDVINQQNEIRIDQNGSMQTIELRLKYLIKKYKRLLMQKRKQKQVIRKQQKQPIDSSKKIINQNKQNFIQQTLEDHILFSEQEDNDHRVSQKRKAAKQSQIIVDDLAFGIDEEIILTSQNIQETDNMKTNNEEIQIKISNVTNANFVPIEQQHFIQLQTNQGNHQKQAKIKAINQNQCNSSPINQYKVTNQKHQFLKQPSIIDKLRQKICLIVTKKQKLQIKNITQVEPNSSLQPQYSETIISQKASQQDSFIISNPPFIVTAVKRKLNGKQVKPDIQKTAAIQSVKAKKNQNGKNKSKQPSKTQLQLIQKIHNCLQQSQSPSLQKYPQKYEENIRLQEQFKLSSLFRNDHILLPQKNTEIKQKGNWLKDWRRISESTVMSYPTKRYCNNNGQNIKQNRKLLLLDDSDSMTQNSIAQVIPNDQQKLYSSHLNKKVSKAKKSSKYQENIIKNQLLQAGNNLNSLSSKYINSKNGEYMTKQQLQFFSIK